MVRNDDDRGDKPTGGRRWYRAPRGVLAANRRSAEAFLALQSRPEWKQAVAAMQQQSQAMRRLMADVQQRWGVIRQAVAAAQRLPEPAWQIIEAAHRISDPMRRRIEDVQREPVRRMIGEAAATSDRIRRWWDEFETQFGIAQAQAAPILRRYKWLVTPSLPVTLVFHVVREGRKRGRRDREINALFMGYLSRDGWQPLQAMINGWEDKPLLKKRMRIVRDCVRAVQAGERFQFNAANVVLPTLVAQIDGAWTEYLESKGVSRHTGYDSKKSEFQKRKDPLLQGPLEEVASFVFVDVLFQSTRHRQAPQIPLGFSRHRVMHGENVHYGRKDYVVRAFLALDYLAHLE